MESSQQHKDSGEHSTNPGFAASSVNQTAASQDKITFEDNVGEHSKNGNLDKSSHSSKNADEKNSDLQSNNQDVLDNKPLYSAVLVSSDVGPQETHIAPKKSGELADQAASAGDDITEDDSVNDTKVSNGHSIHLEQDASLVNQASTSNGSLPSSNQSISKGVDLNAAAKNTDNGGGENKQSSVTSELSTSITASNNNGFSEQEDNGMITSKVSSNNEENSPESVQQSITDNSEQLVSSSENSENGLNDYQGKSERFSNTEANAEPLVRGSGYVEVVSTAISNQPTSVGNDDETERDSVQSAAQTAQDTSAGDIVAKGVAKDDNVVASVSSDDNHSDSSKIQLDESQTGSNQVSNQSTVYITKMDDGRAPLGEVHSRLENNQQDLQPEVSPTVDNGNPNNIAFTNKNVEMPAPEQKSDTKIDVKQSADSNNGSVTTPSVQPALPEQVNNTQGNSKQHSYPGKNNTAPQNARSKWPVIAVSTLAIAGVAAGIAIAVYLEMLAVGIAVGACCLVSAAIIYCCGGPSNSLEKSNAEAATNKCCLEAPN